MGEIGGDRGGIGPPTLRISEVVWTLALLVDDELKDSRGVASGGDMRMLLISLRFLGSLGIGLEDGGPMAWLWPLTLPVVLLPIVPRGADEAAGDSEERELELKRRIAANESESRSMGKWPMNLFEGRKAGEAGLSAMVLLVVDGPMVGGGVGVRQVRKYQGN